MDHEQWRETQATVRIEVDDHAFDIAYTDFGDDDPVTVFLHGIPTWGFLFRDVYDGVGHAVIPDLPGYGYTRHVGEGGYDRSVRVMALALEATLDALDIDTVQLVAHDLGGSAALRFAVNTDRVERLVLSNAGCYDSWPVPFIHELGLPGPARAWTRSDVDEKLEFAFGEGTYGDRDNTFVAGMKAPFIEPTHDTQRLARNAVATNTNHTLEVSHRLDEINAPTLLLWGADDVLQSTTWADQLATDIPSTETRYLDRAYHWVMQDRPDAYRGALASFLE